jgi:hypothetical protein
MDSQRYVSIGDGNVYLMANDPLDAFDVALSDLIDNDDIPALSDVQSIRFQGLADQQIVYQEDSTDTYQSEDVYFVQRSGGNVPLDTSRVNSYLRKLTNLTLGDYVTYTASDADLAQYGLDDPELTATVDYTTDDGEAATFTLSLSRSPEERAAAAEADVDDEDENEDEEITAYVRIGDSSIIYQLSGSDYEALTAATYNDLRHQEMLPADFEDIAQIDITLDGADYTITSTSKKDERTYTYQEEDLDITDLQDALCALTADQFTSERATQKQEISLRLQLDNEDQSTIQIDLYRYDGDSCLAVVDGTPVSLVSRSTVVDLIEAVNAIVL